MPSVFIAQNMGEYIEKVHPIAKEIVEHLDHTVQNPAEALAAAALVVGFLCAKYNGNPEEVFEIVRTLVQPETSKGSLKS